MSIDKKNKTEAEKPIKKLEKMPLPPLEAEKLPEVPAIEKLEVQPAVLPETEQPQARSVQSASVKIPAILPRDPILAQVENILEEDLKDIYSNLPPLEQKRFREEGEEVASRIQKMIIDLKIKAKQILNLIRGWLKIIPGVNRFFLEQEAKIKTDKLMILAKYEEEKKRGEGK